MTGDFELCMEEENDKLKEALLHENAVAIMFPFLRSVIASLTTTANINPLILPVINIANTFKNDK
jgi:preprotein translocase subunit SecB